MANGKSPYKGLSHPEFQAEMESNRIPTLNEDEKTKWSDEFKNFVNDCLIKDPKLRLGAKELQYFNFIINKLNNFLNNL